MTVKGIPEEHEYMIEGQLPLQVLADTELVLYFYSFYKLRSHMLPLPWSLTQLL